MSQRKQFLVSLNHISDRKYATAMKNRNRRMELCYRNQKLVQCNQKSYMREP